MVYALCAHLPDTASRLEAEATKAVQAKVLALVAERVTTSGLVLYLRLSFARLYKSDRLAD